MKKSHEQQQTENIWCNVDCTQTTSTRAYQVEFSIDDTESRMTSSDWVRGEGDEKNVIQNDSKKRIFHVFKAYTWNSEQAIVYVGRFSFSIYLVSKAQYVRTRKCSLIHSVYSNMILLLFCCSVPLLLPLNHHISWLHLSNGLCWWGVD